MDFIMLTLGDSIDKMFYNFDIAVFEFFAGIQNSFLTALAKFFTSFGDEAFVIPMVVLGIVLMLFKKTRKYGFGTCICNTCGHDHYKCYSKARGFKDKTVQHASGC